MNSIYKQCEKQLELERIQIKKHLQQPDYTEGAKASDMVEWQTVQQMRHKLQKVEHALKRLDDGRFGICQECGCPIEPERLLLLATAERCIECQRRLERTLIRQHRRWQVASVAFS